jgi:hypothetical protein
MVGGPEHTWCATDVLPSSMLFRNSRPGKLEAPQRPLEVIYLSWVALPSIIHVKLGELINDCSDSVFLATLGSMAPIKAILLLQESQKSLLKLQARNLKSSKFFLSDHVPSYITLHSCSPILAPIMSSSETFRRAFPERETPKVSYAIPFPAAAAQHVESTFNASRVYIICSGSLAKNTKNLDDLKAALGDKVAGVRIGMTPQTLWSEVLEIAKDSKAANADLLITLGGGSLTDAAKLVSFVCNPGRSLG